MSIQLMRQGVPTAGTLQVSGRDAQGIERWAASFDLPAPGSVVDLPNALGSFEFAMSAGELTRTIHVPVDHIRANPDFLIGLTEADYYRYTTSDNNVEILLPRDPTNPYFEITISAPGGYGWIDRAFYKDGHPISEMPYRGLDSFAVGHQIDNVTFKTFKRFRGQQGLTWDAADSALVHEDELIVHEW